MPLMIDLKRVVIFGGERGEGLQKTEKLSLFAEELLVVPESPYPHRHINLAAGRLPHVGENLSRTTPRSIPVANEPASLRNVARSIAGANFVVSDLVDRVINERITALCEESGTLCNIIDTRDLCNTWFMSLIDSPHLIAAISSKGGCAYYARQTRIELEQEFADREPVADILTGIRDRLGNPLPAGHDRSSILDSIYHDSDFRRAVELASWDAARARAEEIYEHICTHTA